MYPFLRIIFKIHLNVILSSPLVSWWPHTIYLYVFLLSHIRGSWSDYRDFIHFTIKVLKLTNGTISSFTLKVLGEPGQSECRTFNMYPNLNNCLLTPWCKILFEKLIVTQLVKNILLSYGTRRFITVFTKACHRTLSWATLIQLAPSIPISLRSI
jgi:hypothetical protein